MNDIRTGLIGYGLGGSAFHAPLIEATKGLLLAAIKTTNPKVIDEIKRRYPKVEIVATADAIIQNKNLDMVVISVPNEYHFSLAKQALNADKHVVIDKPFSVASAEAGFLMELADSKKKTLTIFQNRRWDGDFLTVQKLVNEKRLGEIVEVEMHFDRFRPEIKQGWKEEVASGTGVLYDLGVHLIDQTLQLFGKPVSLYADIRMQRKNAKSADYFELQLFYNNLKVILKASTLAAAPTPRFLLHGTEGSFVKYGLDVQENALRQGKTPLNFTPWGQEPKENWGTLYTENSSAERLKTEAGNYLAFYKNLTHAINYGGALEVQPQEALDVIQIIELAMKSDRLKKRIKA